MLLLLIVSFVASVASDVVLAFDASVAVVVALSLATTIRLLCLHPSYDQIVHFSIMIVNCGMRIVGCCKKVVFHPLSVKRLL